MHEPTMTEDDRPKRIKVRIRDVGLTPILKAGLWDPYKGKDCDGNPKPKRRLDASK